MLTNTPNSPVLKLPDRKFPGVLIQGDSLQILVQLVTSLSKTLQQGDIEESVALVTELHEALAGRLAIYETVMKANQLELPYRSISSLE
jgi:hypothetical protein